MNVLATTGPSAFALLPDLEKCGCSDVTVRTFRRLQYILPGFVKLQLRPRGSGCRPGCYDAEAMSREDREIALNALERSSLFGGLGSDVLCNMAARLKVERWQRHRVVIRPQQTAERVYVLAKGRVKLSRHNPQTARAVTLFLFGPGCAFGSVGGLGVLPAGVCAEALDEIVALSCPVEQWTEWQLAHPVFRAAVGEYRAWNAHWLAELACDLALHDTMTRLARLILRHFVNAGKVPYATSCLIHDLPHEELAYMIGSVRVVVNRLLAKLKRAGVIGMCAGQLRVLDFERLSQIAAVDAR